MTVHIANGLWRRSAVIALCVLTLPLSYLAGYGTTMADTPLLRTHWLRVDNQDNPATRLTAQDAWGHTYTAVVPNKAAATMYLGHTMPLLAAFDSRDPTITLKVEMLASGEVVCGRDFLKFARLTDPSVKLVENADACQRNARPGPEFGGIP